MANEDKMNADDAVAEAERIVHDADAANANANAEDDKDNKPRIIGWFYAFDADNDPKDSDQLIWVSLEQPKGGEREISIHAGDLIKQHAENRQLLLADVKLLGQALAEHEDANAKDITFRRYAFSCTEELPKGVMPVARFTAEFGASEEGVTISHRCAINSQLKQEVLVGAQRLVAGVTEHLPQLFGQLEQAERDTSNDANAANAQSAAPAEDGGASADAITDIASIAADMAAIGDESAANAAPGNDGNGGNGGQRESKVFGYFYAYDMGVTVDDPGAIAKIDVDEPDEDGKTKLEFSLSSFITDNVDNCGALLAFVSQLYDVLPKSKENGSIYRRYAFTNRPEPPQNTLPLGRIVVEFEGGKPVGSHCETPGDEKLHDDLIGAAHIIESFGPYMRQVFDQKHAEQGGESAPASNGD
ncbi:hypothetical protein [Bifidobacterium biavatii]|uniref:Uncharacterized protein n=1 Tax=Bifidobacterium biavatii DSM 23969 TaxID=1437608 RepID=A0A086ZVX0_9BIFI|nr:hypothetical protein [Bifidobacterium biavatii]KFI50670.1 hypothetical protein BBIA_2018 [Bifidobacterium biavatii DSM 23969]